MNRIIKFEIILSLFAILFVISGCNQKKTRNDHRIRVQIPWADSNGNYSLQIVELKTVTNLKRLSGTAARFLYVPNNANGTLTGEAPFVHFVTNSDGVIIPTDKLSIELFSIYAHLEKLRELDTQLNIKHKSPMTIGVRVNYQNQGHLSVNNAFYSSELKAILFVPYTLPDLPISINGGILAHEYFHSLVDKLVLLPLGDNLKSGFQENGMRVSDSRVVYRNVLVGSINEGLADFWGWAYSGDPDFISHSLKEEYVKGRSLNAKSLYLKSEADLKFESERLRTYNEANARFYNLGTQVARIFKSYSDFLGLKYSLSQSEASFRVSKQLIKAFELFNKKLIETKETGSLSPWHLIEAFVLAKEKDQLIDCDFWQTINQDDERSRDQTELDKVCKK